MLNFVHSALVLLLLLAEPAKAFDCGGTNLFAQLPEDRRAAITARAEATPHPEGLLWKASRGDAMITIFGTYHIAHSMTLDHFEALEPIALAADLALFEMDAADKRRFESRMASDPSLVFIAQGPTIPELLPEEDWQDLRAMMAERGMPGFLAAKAKPIFLSTMLSLSPCQIRAQTQGARGIDAVLAEFLAKSNKPTASIEDPVTTMQVLDAFSREEQVAMLQLSIHLPLDPDDVQTTMLALYQTGQIGKLWEFGRDVSLEYGGPTAADDFAKFESALLTKRNEAWIDVLEAHAPGKTLFVAVGAGHLPGETGVLRLLEARGWQVERLDFPPETQAATSGN